ncbi:MAG: peptidylprolyl isomerase [Azoarcus sp.]|jgi:peptidyl-prolyl cis-trans isomerase C|nr:peptidylprolyl isomerase [Azoarcus sp.]
MKSFMKQLPAVLATIGIISIVGCTGGNSAPPSVFDPNAAPVAIVNGTSIPNEYLEVILAGQRAQGAPADDPQVKENIRKDLIRRTLLEQDAIKAGINNRPETRARQDLAKQDALIRDYVQDWVKTHTPTEDELKQEYETIKSGLGGQKEYHARHILLKTEPEAKAAIAKLDKGAKFAELATKSLDPGSKDKGGDLGWANPSMFVPAFSEAMVKLEKGKYSKEPVKTDYGFHIILLEDLRDLQAPPLDDVKTELQQRLQQKKWQEYIDQIEKSADVK